MSLTFRIIIGIFALGFLILIFVLTNNYQSNIDLRYQTVTNKTEIKSVFVNMKVNRGTLYLDFMDSNHFKLGSSMSNFHYSPNESFYDFIQKGDSIIKHFNCDTLNVIRGDKHFYFILNRRVTKDNL